jgi:low affinity Fe/Cu permease
LVVVIVWAVTGPLFRFSDTWQLAINTGTTVVTFWMVFVIQNSQNRASKAVQLKLDEVIRAFDGAENKFIRLEAAAEGVIAEREAEMDVIAVDTADGGRPVGGHHHPQGVVRRRGTR